MKDQINQYWNSGASRYNQGVKRFLKSESKTIGYKNIFSEYLGSKPLNILDVGTGPGSISVLLAGMGHHITAIDLSEQMLNHARINAESNGVSVDFRIGDAEKLPFEDNSFDAVVNRWVLWTIPHPDVALQEWYRVLKPGGRVCIIDGNWYNGEKKLYQKVWKQFSRLYTSITERRNAWRNIDPVVINDLWSTHAKRPDDDIQLFRNAGFLKVEASMEVNRKAYSTGDHFRLGHWGPTFLVTGIKPQ